jgi:uncharacterized protein YkwD
MRIDRWHRGVGAIAIVLVASCGKGGDPAPAAGVDVAPPPPSGGMEPMTGGTGGMMALPTGGTAPVIPGLCDTSGWAADSIAYEDAVLAAVNAARAAGRSCGDAGLTMPAPLTSQMALQLSARCHALEMSMRGEATLTGANGSMTFDRARLAGYTGMSTAAAVTASARDAAMVVEGLLEEASICDKLVDARWHDVGVGVSPASDTGKRYINVVTGF